MSDQLDGWFDMPPVNKLTPNYLLLNTIPYSYKFSRDVYFTDVTNLAFSQFYF